LIFGIGTDVIEVNRIEKSLLTIDNFKTRVFTEEEVKYCSKYKNGAQHYAGRYAAKEAMFKAIGTGWCDGMMLLTLKYITMI